ncbi:hypothetical protein ACVW00_000320 [Marmoricola sp. URHA0025 HA25]
MTTYVLAFRGQPGRPAPEGAEEKWGAWFGELGSAIADPGSRVGPVATLTAPDHGDPATAVLTGYMTVTADDLEAAASLARGCPGLEHDISVEVAELLEA